MERDYSDYDARSRAEVIALIGRQAKRIAELEAQRCITPEMVDYLAEQSGHRPSANGQVMSTLQELIRMYEASGEAHQS